jgi:hypothetical protein
MTERSTEIVDAEVESVLVEFRQHLSSLPQKKRVSEPDVRRELLARVEAGAAVAARAMDRLPPVVSNRRGWMARVEIALKRFARRMTNWFTWEQINFNAATGDALRAAHALMTEQALREDDLHARVNALEAELKELRRLRADTLD